MEMETVEEVRKIASQIEARQIPPPNRAQSLVLIRQMVRMAEQLERMREELAHVGGADEIMEKDAERYRWLRNNTTECADACGTFLDFPRVDCHPAPNVGDIDAAIDIAMSNVPLAVCRETILLSTVKHCSVIGENQI